MNALIDSPEKISLFPLQTVLFPGNKLPLRIFEPRYVDLIGDCMREGSRFGIVAIEQGQEAGDIPEIFSVGTTVDIIDFDQGQDGLLNVLVEGRQRFVIENTAIGENNLLTATISYLPDLQKLERAHEQPHLEATFQELSQHPELKERINETSDQLEMAFQVIPWLPIPSATKVKLLQAQTAIEVLSSVESYLEQISNKNRV